MFNKISTKNFEDGGSGYVVDQPPTANATQSPKPIGAGFTGGHRGSVSPTSPQMKAQQTKQKAEIGLKITCTSYAETVISLDGAQANPGKLRLPLQLKNNRNVCLTEVVLLKARSDAACSFAAYVDGIPPTTFIKPIIAAGVEGSALAAMKEGGCSFVIPGNSSVKGRTLYSLSPQSESPYLLDTTFTAAASVLLPDMDIKAKIYDENSDLIRALKTVKGGTTIASQLGFDLAKCTLPDSGSYSLRDEDIAKCREGLAAYFIILPTINAQKFGITLFRADGKEVNSDENLLQQDNIDGSTRDFLLAKNNRIFVELQISYICQ